MLSKDDREATEEESPAAPYIAVEAVDTEPRA